MTYWKTSFPLSHLLVVVVQHCYDFFTGYCIFGSGPIGNPILFTPLPGLFSPGRRLIFVLHHYTRTSCQFLGNIFFELLPLGPVVLLHYPRTYLTAPVIVPAKPVHSPASFLE